MVLVLNPSEGSSYKLTFEGRLADELNKIPQEVLEEIKSLAANNTEEWPNARSDP